MATLALNAIVATALTVISMLGGAQTQTKPPVPAGTAVTVGGCLRKWEPAMAKGGILNPANLEYVLTELSPVTASAPPLPPNVLRYLVTPKDSTVVLAPHVNHRVEVSGTATGLAAVTPATAPQAAPTLTVTTVKMVSSECI